MTIGYMRQASTATTFTFIRLLFRWQGSIWKSVHPEMFTWLFCYFVLSCTYRFVLRGTDMGILFERIVINTESYLGRVSSSLNFVLGFYVSYVATRWWYTFTQLPWPDNLFGKLSGFFQSKGVEHKKSEHNIRMSISRYWNAAFIMVLRDISECTRKRFPTLDFLVPSVLTREEVEIIEKVAIDDPHLQSTCLYWMPIDWIVKTLKKAEQHGNLTDLHFTMLVEELMIMRKCLNNLLSQDFLSSTPLSYTQVATVAPVIYFVMCLVGRQFVVVDSSRVDYIFPFYTVYEFLIYFGWLKVAQTMLNPFGLDDDDYEIDFLVQRHYQYGKVILSQIYEFVPNVVDVELKVLPHTRASAQMAAKRNPMIGSVANLKLTEEEKTRLSLPQNLPVVEKIEPKRCARSNSVNTPIRLSTPSVRDMPLNSTMVGFSQRAQYNQLLKGQNATSIVGMPAKQLIVNIKEEDKQAKDQSAEKTRESSAPFQTSLERKNNNKNKEKNRQMTDHEKNPNEKESERKLRDVDDDDKTQPTDRVKLRDSSSKKRQRTKHSKELQQTAKKGNELEIDKTQQDDAVSRTQYPAKTKNETDEELTQ